ncbi:MAG: transcriptional repressor LexA [Gemmatimonadota bacterium]
MEPLTALERDIYRYLVEYVREHTYQPSVREIGRRFEIGSTKTVAAHLCALAGKGWVERDPSRSRGIRLVGSSVFPDCIEVQSFRGVATEGEPFCEDLCDGSYHLDRSLAGCDEAFLFPMADDSMSEDGILDGDTLVVAPATERDVSAGELILARIDGDSVVRRVPEDPRGGSAGNGSTPSWLSPEHRPARILGRVVGVYRQYAGRAR